MCLTLSLPLPLASATGRIRVEPEAGVQACGHQRRRPAGAQGAEPAVQVIVLEHGGGKGSNLFSSACCPSNLMIHGACLTRPGSKSCTYQLLPCYGACPNLQLSASAQPAALMPRRLPDPAHALPTHLPHAGPPSRR